jgi:hypothetical protein
MTERGRLRCTSLHTCLHHGGLVPYRGVTFTETEFGQCHASLRVLPNAYKAVVNLSGIQYENTIFALLEAHFRPLAAYIPEHTDNLTL